MNRLILSAQIFDHNSKVIDIKVQAQYFSLSSKKWVNLGNANTLKSFAFQYVLNLNTRMSKDLGDQLNNNSLPAFRLIVAKQNRTESLEVLSCGYEVNIRKRPQRPPRSGGGEDYNLQFGKLFYHHQNVITKYKLEVPDTQRGFRSSLIGNSDVGNTQELEDAIKKLQAEKAELNNELVGANKVIRNEQIKVEEAKQESEKEAEARLKAEKLMNTYKVDLETLREEVREGKKGGPANISSIYNHMIEDVEDSLTKSRNSRFTIGKISMDLKGLVVNDNGREKFQLLDTDLAKQIRGDVISNVHIEISDKGEEGLTLSTVPKVIGLTETAARNLLHRQNLQLNAIYQSTKKVPRGQAFKQTPSHESNEQVTENTAITVVFAK